MAKFYVESGSVQAVVDCMDMEAAALWAVNLVMEETDTSELLDEEDVLHVENVTTTHHLDETIRVSEQGFGRADAVELQTSVAFQDWFELSRAIDAMTADW